MSESVVYIEVTDFFTFLQIQHTKILSVFVVDTISQEIGSVQILVNKIVEIVVLIEGSFDQIFAHLIIHGDNFVF